MLNVTTQPWQGQRYNQVLARQDQGSPGWSWNYLFFSSGPTRADKTTTNTLITSIPPVVWSLKLNFLRNSNRWKACFIVVLAISNPAPTSW